MAHLYKTFPWVVHGFCQSKETHIPHQGHEGETSVKLNLWLKDIRLLMILQATLTHSAVCFLRTTSS